MHYKEAFFVVLIIFQLISPSSCAGHGGLTFKCKDGWKLKDAVCYLEVTTPMNWDLASHTCESVGAYLVRIEDETENCYIRSTLASNKIWIGLSRNADDGISVQTGEGVWNKKEVVSDNDGIWDVNQPDTDGDKLKCVAANKMNLGRWSYQNCLTKLPFICKQKAVLDGYFQCLNGDAIPTSQTCDDENDCGDNSDEINCPSKCRYLLTGSKGPVTYNPYQDRKTCYWAIVGPIGSLISLTVKAGTNIEKNADFIEIGGRGKTLKSSLPMAEVSGNIITDAPYRSQNNILRLRMNSDNSETGGLIAEYTAVYLPEDEKLTAEDAWKSFTSPYHPFYMPLFKQFEWTITAKDSNVVTIKFEDVHLQEDSDSYLIVFDGDQLSSPIAYSYDKVKEMPKQKIYTSRTKSVRIVLLSFQYGLTRGIKISYKQGCTIEITDATSGMISSPGYHVNADYGYPNDVKCSWLIKHPSTVPISLRFNAFNLKQNSDYLKLYNDTATTTALHPDKGFSGNGVLTDTTIFSSSDGVFKLEFDSNMALTANGFTAMFDTDCELKSPLSQWTKTEPMIEKYTPFDTEITVTCMTGYSFKQEEYKSMSSVSLKCMDGSWNVTRIPDCQISHCGTPPPIQNGYIDSSSGVTYGENATYKCDEGFTIDKSTILCQADGSWQTKPTCSASDCPTVPVITNGKHKSVDGVLAKFGNIIDFECDPGYQTVGSVRIYCKTEGWSHAPPQCKEITCPIPMVTEGSISANTGVLFGKTTSLNCNSGYNVNGTTSNTQQLKCGSDGTFLDPQDEKSELLCVDINECVTSNPCKTNQKCMNNVGSYTCPCKDGFKPHTDPTQDCININECQVNNGGCSFPTGCTDATPGYSCTCGTGYELYTADGFNNISLAMGEDGKREGDVYYIDHTCVRKQCTQPVAPANGVVLSKKQLFYYGDTVKYKCNHGYLMSTINNPSRICSSNGQWNSAAPSCNAAVCTTQLKSSDANINRVLPGSGASINYGEESIIECEYGTKMINKTQYCGYTGSDTYGLLGDSNGCPVIDCGKPESIPASSFVMPSKTTYSEAFDFTCQTGFKAEGQSTQGNYKVMCEENGRWGMGNLTCRGEKCVDPGTPGGAEQVVTSYEVGELVYYRCKKSGYEPVPPEPLLCEIVNTEVKWNNTDLPDCKDVTAPTFSNCPTDMIYVDYMDAVSYTVPTAADNSGAVKSMTVSPDYFKPNIVIAGDTTVTYTAQDYAGNEAKCVIQIKIKPRQRPVLTCPLQRVEFINSSVGHSIDIKDIVNVSPSSSVLTFSPSQTLMLDVNSIRASEKEITVTAKDPYGTTDSCSFLLATEANACFEGAFPTKSFSQRTCTPGTSNNLTCEVTCNQDHIFDDGKAKKTYSCEGSNTWTPRSSPHDCLPYVEPAYRVEITVVYSIAGGQLASACVANHDTLLKGAAFRNSLASELEKQCSNILTVNDITVEDKVTSTTQTFLITTKFVAVISNANSESTKQFCGNTLQFQINRGDLNNVFLYGTTITCDGNAQATLSISSVTVPNPSTLCSSGTLLKTTDLGDKCVSCPLGTYFSVDKCVSCPDGQYQDVAGQTMCKTCVSGKSPSLDKTTCEDLCRPGFINTSSYKFPCSPCPEDKYWVNASYCEDCPAGHKTLGSTASKSVSDCKAPCAAGTYSVSGYVPCTACPLHHYQDKTGQNTCTACSDSEITENTGSVNSSYCIDQSNVLCNASVTQCNGNGVCSVKGHMKVCTCNAGYKGDNCENAEDPCEAKPCFNGGTCTKTGVNTYNCTCPVDDSCRMVRMSGNFVGEEGKQYNSYAKFTLEACETDCINAAECKTVYYTNGVCFLYNHNTQAISYPQTSTLSRKVCDYTVLFTGDQCEKDELNSCVNNTDCGSYGMCQDGLSAVVNSQTQLSSFKCLCQKEGEFTGDRCERKTNLCEPNPCQNNGKCMSFGDIRRHCECLPGYTGKNCETNVDECKMNPNGCLYDGECKDGVNTYTCTCKSGFTGERCQSPANLCTQDPCANGLCYNNYDNYTSVCVCEKPYQLGGNGKCVAMDPCTDVICKNGTCKNGVCECEKGFEGSQCQHDIDDCKKGLCQNEAECMDGYDSFVCKCKPGYSGNNCETNIDDCVGMCDGTKTVRCDDKVDDFECICKPGYKGKNCTEEINECDSYPCKHESQCMDKVADYECNCTAGWTGKDCGTPINYCVNSPCKNGGQCHNLIDGYFCKCQPGTRGDTCNIFPQVCGVVKNTCTNAGVCWDTKGTAVCNCTDNYTGNSCSLIKDRCSENICKNDGTCQNKDLGFECKCAASYSGTTCETYSNPCSGSKCHNTAMCKSEKDKHLCLCTEGRTLTDKGCKDTFEDWDMFFDTKVGGEGAFLRTPFMLGTQEFSVAFWTRFKVNDDDPKPTLIQLEISSVANPLSSPIVKFFNPNLDYDISKLVVFKVDNDSVYMSNTTNDKTIPLEDTISDGKWHHVAVTWKASGETQIIVDGIRQQEEGVTSLKLPEYAQLVIGQNLNGRMSRVTVWKTALTYTDIVVASSDLNHKPTGMLAQGWTNYILSRGSERMFPSKARQEPVCDLGLENDKCPAKNKERPKIGKCPTNGKEIRGTSRLNEVDGLKEGDDITFTSSSQITYKSTLPTDKIFGYGAHSEVVIGQDQFGNYADCRFKVYVKRSQNCKTPVGGAIPTYCQGSSGSICSLQCGANHVSQAVPKIFKCGKLAAYYTEDVCENKPVEAFVLPSCGASGLMKRKVDMKLQYKFKVGCTSGFETSLKDDIMVTFNTLRTTWSGICTLVNCPTVTVTAICSTTQNDVADITIIVTDLGNTVSKSGVQYTPKQAFRILVFEEKVFTYTDVGASVLVIETVQIAELQSCGTGYAIVGNNCVQCPPGSYYVASTSSCRFCDIGQYQSSTGQTSCLPCGGTKTTLKVGSKSAVTDCVDKCLPGKFYDGTSCQPCPKHHYQNEEGKTSCKGCPVGKKTSGTGSNSSSDCFDDCDPGTELKPDGSCKKCAKGYYRTAKEDECQPCNANFTTESEGTTTSEKCDIRKCYAGNFRNATSNLCQPCPVGEYQPKDLQDSCESCGTSYSTKEEGNDNKTSCIFYCNAGEEVESASGEKCRKCARGKYKDNMGNDKFEMCKMCPVGNTTVGEGSKSESDCHITYCSAGTFRNTMTNQCEKCPLGQYQEKDLAEKCDSCGTNYFTRKDGSNNQTDCEFHCNPGFEIQDAAAKSCRECPRGFYRDNKVGFYFTPCQQCPSGNTTNSIKSTSENDCSILNCTMGQVIDSHGGCKDCQKDTFQPMDSPTSSTQCQKCKDGTATKQEKSTMESQCEPFCLAGQQYNTTKKSCELCPKGTHNSGSETMKFESCMKCPENYTTAGEGSKSENDCNLLDCDPGYKISGNFCIPCGFGYYNSKRHQADCLPCVTANTKKDLNTSTTTSTSVNECQTYCQPGFSGADSCVLCPDGQIKPKPGVASCDPCVGNYTSNAARTACDQLFCDKGFYYTSTGPMCMACDVGKYKDKRGNDVTCTSCDPGFTTAEQASDSKAKCDQKHCVKGKYYNSSTDECVSCPMGTYKDTVGNSACTDCWYNLTTSGTESTDQSQCAIIVCEAGEKRVGTTTCEKCERGSYQPNRGKTACVSCGSGKTTMQDTSKSSTDCVPLCVEGEEYQSATKKCTLCDFGYFKSTKSNDVRCMTCPQSLKTTKTKGSTSSSQCTEDICGAGTKRVSNVGCVPCPRGEYQDKQEQTSCNTCGSGRTTVNNGTTSISDCITDCADGKRYDYTTKVCVNCAVGWYTDRNKDCCKCLKCPNNKITAFAGSNNCIDSGVTATTQAPRGQVVLKFTFKYRIALSCTDVQVRVAFIAKLKLIVGRRIVFLRIKYRTLCSNSDCSSIIPFINIRRITCGGINYSHSKKRSTERDVDFDVEIPNIGETATDDAGSTVKTDSLVQEDFNANTNQYTEPNFKPQTISQGTFEKVCEPGDVLDTGTNTCRSCPKGTYYHNSSKICMGCEKNKYQDKVAQFTCKDCTGINKYTANVNSTSASDCISECAVNSGYCKNGGTCKSDQFSVYCSCSERYEGTYCETFKTPTSNTDAIVGGAIGGGAALLLIVLLIVGICVYFRSPSKSYYRKDKKSMSEFDADMYRNPIYDNRPHGTFPPQMNRSFVMDDYDGDAVYNPYSKNPGRATVIDEENSEFRWKPAS